jgi:hypothetical protein
MIKRARRIKSKKGEKINIQAHESFHVTDTNGPRLILIREYFPQTKAENIPLP